ncbi:ABC-three component system middle component 8 [Pseudogulbenkiania ferrooxidans]|uniref:ABC-three component system middle component 8 n=1 Tax=Pseudogulbenkiania ferrooxidans TaxID=549169 RepID=UPI0009DBB19D|nr:ABC-three component system middle component 8 [Pseudogulbenkiania ferrooxidans]
MRLTLTRHTHPDQTVVAAATVILKRLKKSRIEKYDDLRNFLLSSTRDSGPLFMPALNLLYLLGLIEYAKKTDSFEYIGL